MVRSFVVIPMLPPRQSAPPAHPAETGGVFARFARAAAFTVVPGFGALAIAALGGASAPSAAAVAVLAGGVGGLLSLRLDHLRAAMPGPASDPGPPDGRALAAEALEALPDPVVLVEAGDADDFAARRLVSANRAARELLRIPPEGGLLLSAIRRPEVLKAVDESLFEGGEASTAYETGGAQDRFWRVWARPLAPTAEGKRLALLVMRDETDSRRNERMRADFLANASHELRTPLASLAGFIETLRGHAREDPVARDRFLRIMSGQAERMRRLIEDLLSLSRVELNEHIPPSADCDLVAVVADVSDANALLMQERGVTLDLRAPAPGDAMVVGDRDQILQVVQNLLDNAVKYSPENGTVRIEVVKSLDLGRAQAADTPILAPAVAGWARLPLLTPDHSEGERFALIKVMDAGPGIAREYLPRLAERFYRVEGQKSGERSGTGLGLAIVKHIVNRHRGGLTVESAAGRGSAFSAYFPMRAEPAGDAAAAPPADGRTLAAVTKTS